MASVPTITSNSSSLSQISSATNAVGALGSVVLAVANIFGGGAGPGFTQGYQPGFPPPDSSGANVTVPSQLPPALLFHYEGEQTVTVESDITDHYIEDNTAIQDQIALRPEIITTHGFIGDLNDVPPAILSSLQSIANSLTTIGAYAPTLSATAIFAYNEAFQAYQTASSIAQAGYSAFSSLSGSGGKAVVAAGAGPGNIAGTGGFSQSKQQIMFQQLYSYMQQRVLFTVQTPWAVFLNCAIKTLRAIQDETTRYITDFQVEFKVIKTATTSTSQTPVGLGRWLLAAQPTTALGNANTGATGSLTGMVTGQ